MADVQPQDHDDRDEDNQDEQPVVGSAPRSFTVPGNDVTGYLGVAPEYMNYADPTNKPYMTETEAYLYTNLTNDQIEATRNRTMPDGMELPKNEMPAIAENTGGMGLFAEEDTEDSKETESDETESGADEVKPDGEQVSGTPEPTRPPLSANQ